VRFYNKRGTAEQWIKEGRQAVRWTRLSCHRFRANEVRLQLSVLAYNLGNLWRQLVLPARIDACSVTSLQQRLVKTGGRLVKHARYYWLLLAESPSGPTLIRVDAPADPGAPGAHRLMRDGGRSPAGRREGGTRGTCPQECWRRLAACRDLGTGRVLRREIHVTKEISRQRGLVGVGCGRSIVVKSEISG